MHNTPNQQPNPDSPNKPHRWAIISRVAAGITGVVAVAGGFGWILGTSAESGGLSTKVNDTEYYVQHHDGRFPQTPGYIHNAHQLATDEHSLTMNNDGKDADKALDLGLVSAGVCVVVVGIEEGIRARLSK